MYGLKLYIVKIIVVVAILQLGGLCIQLSSFRRLYTLVGGVILMSTIFSFNSINVDFSNYKPSDEITIPAYEDVVKNTFKNKLEKTIHENINDKYNINSSVEVATDMEKLEILIVCNEKKANQEEIYNYIKNKYCTENDKVVVKCVED